MFFHRDLRYDKTIKHERCDEVGVRERMMALRLKEKLEADGMFAERIGVEIRVVDVLSVQTESEAEQ